MTISDHSDIGDDFLPADPFCPLVVAGNLGCLVLCLAIAAVPTIIVLRWAWRTVQWAYGE